MTKKVIKLNLPEDYLDDVLVRMAHHSSAIENNTISLAETVSILLYNTIPSKTSVRELYEVLNHKQAFEMLLTDTSREDYVSVVCDIHEKLMDRLHHEKGMFKRSDNAIRGADFDTTPPSEVQLAMKQWRDNLMHRENSAVSEQDLIDISASAHLQFEWIHPFSNGNGRTGRMFTIFFLMKHDIPAVVIEKDDKERYIFLLANQDESGLATLFSEKIAKERDRLIKFEKSEAKLDQDSNMDNK